MRKIWRLGISPADQIMKGLLAFHYQLPVSRQMALDHALWEHLPNSPYDFFLRFYTMDSASYTLGYFMAAKDPGLVQALSQADGPVVRRITGGGIVPHGRDLVFSLGIRRSLFPSLKKTQESYFLIHEVLQKVFLRFGYQTQLADESVSTQMKHKNLCFQNPVPGDLMMGMMKVAGGAQKRSRDTFLHQGSLLLDWGFGANFEARELAGDIADKFSAEWGMHFSQEELPVHLRERAEVLTQTRYLPVGERNYEPVQAV